MCEDEDDIFGEDVEEDVEEDEKEDEKEDEEIEEYEDAYSYCRACAVDDFKPAIAVADASIYIVYSKNGVAVSDFEVEDWVKNVLKFGSGSFSVSTFRVINVFRRMIARGELKVGDVKFFYNGVEVVVNEFGAIVDWPLGFGDGDVKCCEDILHAAFKRSKFGS